MHTRLLIAAASVIAVAACSKDSTTLTSTTPTAKVYTISLDSGMVDSASANVSTTIPVKIHVTKAGTGVAGAAVTWSVTTGHGTLSSASTTTDANGATQVNWTLGDTVGLNTLAISALDATASFRAVGIATAASNLTKVSPDTSSIVAGGSLILTARALDRLGNPVVGATILWTTSAGALSTTSSVSGANGNASTALTTSAKGTYTVTAILPNRATVIFTVTAI